MYIYFLFLIRIRDRGGGMTRSVLDRIFDYHYSSNNFSNKSIEYSHTRLDDHLYDQFVIENNSNTISGYERKKRFSLETFLKFILDMDLVFQHLVLIVNI